jgi:hypothetical protein
MGDSGSATPVAQVFAGRCLEWRWMHCECANNTRFLFSSTLWIESLSKDSQRRSNGLVSGSTLEGCECSEDLATQPSCLRKFSRFCSLCTIDEPLFPNLKSLELWVAVWEFVPFIPSFLSSRTTEISITFSGYGSPTAAFASMVTTLPGCVLTYRPSVSTPYQEIR